MTSEIWKPVDGYESIFLVSNKGNIWSLRSKKVLKQSISKTGYKLLSTRIGGRKGKTICFRVHRLVAKAFVDNPYDKECVNHKDGIKTNNDEENLEWCTKKENSDHAVKHHLIVGKRGEDHASSVLNQEFIQMIMEEYIPYSKTNGLRALSRKYGVKHNTLSNALNMKSKYFGK